jgi:hypothetical protein
MACVAMLLKVLDTVVIAALTVSVVVISLLCWALCYCCCIDFTFIVLSLLCWTLMLLLPSLSFYCTINVV